MPAQIDAVATDRPASPPARRNAFDPARLLAASARTWFITALIGQLVFSVYIAVVYGGATLSGDVTRWNRIMPNGHVPGDRVGNTAIALHVLLAVLIMAGGAAQLVPAIRRRWPALHRWTGRAYMVTIALTSIAGLYLVWGRGSVGDLSQHVAISLNAVILCTCGALAWQRARSRDYAAHRRWALRTYLAANGVFFFRLSLFLWLVIHQRPVGFDPESFSGPFLTVLAFSVYVFVPIGVLELYFGAQRSTDSARQRATAVGLFVLSAMTAAGIAAVSMIIWIPTMME